MQTQKPPTKSRLLKNHLLDQIKQQNIPIGGRLPSETSLMQKFSLSRSTVRQVLSELTIEGLIERQQGRGTFRAGGVTFPRAPAAQRSMLVGVWFNWPSGPLFGPIAEGIREELRKWGYHAVFEVGGLESGAEYRGIESLARKGLDGFILSPSTNLDDEHGPLIELIHGGMPLVLVDRQLPGYQTDLVSTNNELGAEEIVEHLISLGHRRIGFLSIPGLSTLDERLSGYRHMMQRHGQSIDDAWVCLDRSVADDCGRRLIRRVLALPAHSRPTAFFGATDVLAGTIADVAGEMGLSVPGDLSVAGFDNITIDKPAWLTTYEQPKQQIGIHAARLLMKRLHADPQTALHPSNGRHVNPGHTMVLLQGRLIERGSTAAPRN